MYSAVPRTEPALVSRVLPKRRGDAEVGEFYLAACGQEQIARLDVAVDYAAVVGVAECAADFDDDADNFPPIEAPAATEFFLQAVAVDQFHGIE